MLSCFLFLELFYIHSMLYGMSWHGTRTRGTVCCGLLYGINVCNSFIVQPTYANVDMYATKGIINQLLDKTGGCAI